MGLIRTIKKLGKLISSLLAIVGVIWIVGYYWADVVIRFTRIFSKLHQRFKRRRIKPAKQANVYKNIPYKSNYPNNKLDIYVPGESSSVHPTPELTDQKQEKDPSNPDVVEDCQTEMFDVLKPVIVYFHGGGFAWGDKIDERRYLLEFVKAGYAVVAANYALTPMYKYPVPIIQASEVMDFLVSEGEQYGLDPDNIVLAGLSAGGHLAGQLALAESSSAYAGRLGLSQHPDLTIRGIMLNSALIDPNRSNQVGHWLINWLFSVMGFSYMDMNPRNMKEQMLAEANLLNHINEALPPVYISDGNRVSFTQQATDLVAQLRARDIYVQSNIYTDDYPGFMFHGYEGQLWLREARENVDKQLDFLETVID
ncbi:alpha/beta hydrolase [Dolosigranulum pigrum]|uniref:Alpha/beta hydrolase n=1 Tax=Dolosigranulum pigrum TaxID=29394 RepID=A0A516GG86_9LACT|nr:alpha/beta hydrolase [Dolosigranulum pigrum]